MKTLKFWLLFLWCTFNPLPPLFPFRWSGFDSLYDIYPFKRPGTIDSVTEMWCSTGLLSWISGSILMVASVLQISPPHITISDLIALIIGVMWALRGMQLIKSRPIH